ncbi:hypothetical protein DBV10_06565 [Acidovorax sp. FJL06]|nr:hypothetical protein DBV10_06565 [Acidovorax sp. FJL06]
MRDRGSTVSPPGRPKAKRGPLGGQGATRSARPWGPHFFIASCQYRHPCLHRQRHRRHRTTSRRSRP